MKSETTMLIDTNVWLDVYDGERSRHVQAKALLNRASEQGATLTYSVSSLKDVYYALTRMAKRRARAAKVGLSERDALSAEELAWACIQNMQEIATPVAVDLSDVWLAGSYRKLHRDFEDDLIAAAATRCKADVLVTNDERFLRHCPVRAMDAADALTYLTLSAYR